MAIDNDFRRDWHGVQPRYRRQGDGREATRLRELAQSPLVFDPNGIQAAWGMRHAPHKTVLAGIERAPTVCMRVAATPSAATPSAATPSAATPSAATGAASASRWATALEADVASIAASVSAPALALGGGLDAAVVLAAWRACGRAMPTVYTLETGLNSYDEVEAAAASASGLGQPCWVVRVSPNQLVDLLPQSIAAIETPLYGLHPVSRLALALEVHRRGHDALITGDGADAAFVGQPDFDYVPLVAALTTATGLQLRSPFLLAGTLAATLAAGPDPAKSAARAYANTAKLPAALHAAPKRARSLPPLPIDDLLNVAAIHDLANAIGMTPFLTSDRERVGWATLRLLAEHLEGD